MKVTIIGAGAYALALGNLLHQNTKAKIKLWTPFLSEYEEITSNHTHRKVLNNIPLAVDLNVTMNLDETLDSQDLIIIAVPCNCMREVLLKIKNYLNEDDSLVLVSKGLEHESNLTMCELYKSLNLKAKFAYLAGPTYANELILNHKSALTLASEDLKITKYICNLFRDTNVEIEIIKDYQGLELYSVLKNIMAIFMGCIDCKFKSETTKAYYLTKMYKLANEIVFSCGGQKETANCYGALGDILLTCNSKKSRNYTYGMLLYSNREKALEYKKEYTVEGSFALAALIKKLNNKSHTFILKLQDFENGNISFDELLKYI